MNRDPLVIVGGGLAGGAAALLADRPVLLLERDRAPAHKVCGEFISVEAQAYLARLGLDLCSLGAVPIERVRWYDGTRSGALRLPFPAISLSRRVLDAALLDRAAAAGAEIRRGVRVVAIDSGSTRVRCAGGETHAASTLFLASGKHDLRDLPRPQGLQPGLTAFKQHLRLDPTCTLDRTVELHLFDGGYAGLEPVEAGATNLCLVVDRSLLAGGLDGVLATLKPRAPALVERLAGALPLAPPCAITRIPYGHLRWRSDGLWRLGDQAAVIPSLTGDGMSIALHSAFLAADMLRRGRSADDFQRQLALDLWPQMALATTVAKLVVRGWPRRVIGAAASVLPSFVSALAQATRVPARRLLSSAVPA